MHEGGSRCYLGNGHIVVQVLEGHSHGVKGQNHATLCLALALPVKCIVCINFFWLYSKPVPACICSQKSSIVSGTALTHASCKKRYKALYYARPSS